MNTFMQAMLWTCRCCGFQLEGGQPPYECPICESYKTTFMDIPQHLERDVREAHTDLPHNHVDLRTARVALIKEHKLDRTRRASGRILPAASGNAMNPSREY